MNINKSAKNKVLLVLVLTGLISIVGLTGCDSKNIETSLTNENTEQMDDTEQTDDAEQSDDVEQTDDTVQSDDAEQTVSDEQNVNVDQGVSQEDNQGGEADQELNNESSEDANQDNTEAVTEEKSLTQLMKLIGLKKDEVERIINESSNSIDEGGLEFADYGVRIWFDENLVVNQVFIMSNEFDLNGVKIGDKISEFTKAFGEPIKDSNGDAHYKVGEIYLSVNYDTATKETFAVYVLKNDF
ncbi:MAG: hypothetical protein K0S41_217 [Anaerocolumna sp.]|jgi:hypothetical protein|nr:hypothetical protein [Anaerocolumna sp.]